MGTNSKDDLIAQNFENLKTKKVAELVQIAKELKLTGYSDLKKQELIFKIIEAQTLDKIKLALTSANEQKIYFLKGLLEIIPNIPELQEDRAF